MFVNKRLRNRGRFLVDVKDTYFFLFQTRPGGGGTMARTKQMVLDRNSTRFKFPKAIRQYGREEFSLPSSDYHMPPTPPPPIRRKKNIKKKITIHYQTKKIQARDCCPQGNQKISKV